MYMASNLATFSRTVGRVPEFGNTSLARDSWLTSHADLLSNCRKCSRALEHCRTGDVCQSTDTSDTVGVISRVCETTCFGPLRPLLQMFAINFARGWPW